MKLNELTIIEAAKGLREKKFSVAELVSDCIDAIENRNSDLNAYLQVFEIDGHAKEADKKLSEAGTLPPLFGIPLAVKDNILIEGTKTTAGSKILENYIATYDATAVRKLKDQGAIFLGKTNLDEFAMGSSTENSAFGPTKNPFDSSRVPGGSSGGSAAAVAANLCLGALGSDTGGSIRQPASLCGVVGFKPTYGRVSRHGLIAMASSLDQIGPFAKTVADSEIIYDAIQGKDEFDATTVAEENYFSFEKPGLVKEVKVGIPREYFGEGLDSDVSRLIKDIISKVETNGGHIEEISLPHAKYALTAYYIIVPSEVSSNLARFDGIRYGTRIAKEGSVISLSEVYAHTRQEYLGAEVKRRIMLGTYALSAGYYDAYYLKAQKVRRLIREDFEKAFKKVDIIMGPTTPTPAFRFGERAKDPLQMYLADIYTVAINLAGLPGISIPAGRVIRDGVSLPVGIQVISPWFQEKSLFTIAKHIEKISK